MVDELHAPTLQLIYLPHLDYDLQRHGPESEQARAAAAAMDEVLRSLTDFARHNNQRVIILSEYGIEPVSQPVHLNRALRNAGLLHVRSELGRELLDAGASKAFAVADHQIAHVYVNDARELDRAADVIRQTPGVEQVLTGEARRAAGLGHRRAGDIIAVAARGAWFTYYYWNDNDAPDFARTVDIHRKPGYDPVELFVDPTKPFMAARIAWKLLKRKLGFRALLDVIPLDAKLVKGSHGRPPATADDGPIFITDSPQFLNSGNVAATEVRDLILSHIFD
jgi:predicted AlkP superfamily pyrophosphatase or phosphodiesterase